MQFLKVSLRPRQAAYAPRAPDVILLHYLLPFLLLRVVKGEVRKGPGQLGVGIRQFPSAGFSSDSPSSWDCRLAKHMVQISEIIHCGFHLSELVSAPKKGLNKTGSFSWI